MSKHLQRDLDGLKRDILAMGTLAEEATAKAVEAVFRRDETLAQEVIDGDDLLDAKEIAVEEECLKILALHQPVAADLRFIVAVLKVNNDLERMGDLAKNVAKRTGVISESGPGDPVSGDLRIMMERVRGMVHRSLESLVRLDPVAARAVCEEDDAVDVLNRQIFKTLRDTMSANAEEVPRGLAYIAVARNLERIADLATNIAEDVVFTVEGEVIRHRGGEEETAPAHRA